MEVLHTNQEGKEKFIFLNFLLYSAEVDLSFFKTGYRIFWRNEFLIAKCALIYRQSKKAFEWKYVL